MNRIERIFIADKALRPTRTYTAAFVTMQAVPRRYGRNRHTIADSAVQSLIAYVARHDAMKIERVGGVVLA